MRLDLLCKVIAALAVLGVVSANDPKPPETKNNAGKATSPSETTQVSPGQTTDPTQDKKDWPPLVLSLFEKLDFVKKGITETLPYLDIPEDLSGKSDQELVEYTEQLKKRRKDLQTKMLIHLAVTGVLSSIETMNGIEGFGGQIQSTLYWANLKYREALNADWKVHQVQLANFILEYARIKQVDLNNLKKIKIPITNNKTVEFPVWITKRGEPLPRDSELYSLLSVIKNWRSKK